MSQALPCLNWPLNARVEPRCMKFPPDDAGLSLRGMCASPGCATGRARVVSDVRHLDLVRAGEIAILRYAWPAAAQVLGRAGAVVAERGGALCSLGTLARESEVPCVVGAAGVTAAARDGDWVFVDADAGMVLLLEPVTALPI